MSGAALGAIWGATHGRELHRRALDGEKPTAVALVIAMHSMSLAFAVAVCTAGMLAPHRADGRTWGSAVAVGVLGGSGVVSLVTLLEVISRWWWRRRRPQRPCLAVAPSGHAATAVVRSRAALVAPLGLTLALTLTVLAMAVVARDDAWLAGFFVLLACVPAARVLPFLLGRVSAGGIYLTPAGVEHRWGVRTTMIPWEGFAVPREQPLRLRSMLDVPVTETKTFPIDILGGITDRVPGEKSPVPTGHLALGVNQVMALLDFYSRHPRRRVHLGTSRSLDWEPTLPSPVTMTDPPRRP